MKICVLGGSGGMGSLVIEQALTRGWNVTTLVRHPEKVSLVHPQLLVIQGDATKSDDIVSAAQGCDVIIDCVSVGLRHHKPTHIYSSVTKAVITARSQLSATHHIVMSSTGTHQGRRELPWIARVGYEWLLGDVADDKEIAEQLLYESTIPRTIIKAVKLLGTISSDYQTMYFIEYHPSLTHLISRTAVAKAICDTAHDQLYLHQKIVIY